MPPVRVKVYGLFRMTRRTYLALQSLFLVVVATAVAVGLWWPRKTLTAGNLTQRQKVFLLMLDMLPWVALVFLLLGGLETWLILRRFARKQAEADRAEPPRPS
jgi:hypothetical protein